MAPGSAAVQQRGDGLLHEAGLALGGGLDRPQMAGVQPEGGEGADAAGHGQRLGVVVAGHGGQQAVVLQLGEGLLVELGGGEQLLAAEADLGGRVVGDGRGEAGRSLAVGRLSWSLITRSGR